MEIGNRPRITMLPKGNPGGVRRFADTSEKGRNRNISPTQRHPRHVNSGRCEPSGHRTSCARTKKGSPVAKIDSYVSDGPILIRLHRSITTHPHNYNRHRPSSPSLLSFLPVSLFFTDTNIIIQQNDLTLLTNFPRSTSPDPLSPEQPHNTQPSTPPAPLFTNPHPTSQPRPHTQSLRVWGRG